MLIKIDSSMAEYYDYNGEAPKLGYHEASKGLQESDQAHRSSAYRHADELGESSTIAEFNPRADSPLKARGYYTPPPLSAPAHELGTVDPPTTTVQASRWWVSPAAAATDVAAAPASSITNYGGNYPRSLQDMPTSYADANMSAAVLHAEGAAPSQHVDRAFHAAGSITSNNPYLTPDVPNRPVPTWQQEWSEAGCYPSLRSQVQRSGTAASHDHGERGVFHPVFSNQQSHAAPFPASAHDLPQYATVLDRPMASPLRPSHISMHSDNNNGSRAALQDCWPASHQGRLSVGKSQSMRALYEENAALRRALQSIRTRGSLASMMTFDFNGVRQTEQGVGDLDRYITGDVAEGRAVSMRERGRWAKQATDGVDGNTTYPMYVGTPRQQWAAGSPLYQYNSMQAVGRSGGHHRRPCHHAQSQWWDEDMTAEHPSLYYSGGSFGGWPDSEPILCRDDVLQHEHPRGAAREGANADHQAGTSLRQLLGGGSQKWGREGKRRGSARRRTHEVEEERQSTCAMCGGRLRLVDGGKSRAAAAGAGGLPLRLCLACHPRAAASLPHSTKSPLALPPTHSHRHNVATAVLMACRPTTTAAHDHEDVDSAGLGPPATSHKQSSRSGSRNILDLCRQLVGLSTKPPPSSD